MVSVAESGWLWAFVFGGTLFKKKSKPGQLMRENDPIYNDTERFENEGLRCCEGTLRALLWSIPFWFLVVILILAASGCAIPLPQKRFHKTVSLEIEVHVCDAESCAELPVIQEFMQAEGFFPLGAAADDPPRIWIVGEWTEDGIRLPSIVTGHEIIHQLFYADPDFAHPHYYTHDMDRVKR